MSVEEVATLTGNPDGNNFKWAVWCNDSSSLTNYTTNRTFNVFVPHCVGANYNFSCGQEVNESCTMDGNLSASGTCFKILANDITLDCAGFTITGNISNTSASGIYDNGYSNLTVKNCSINTFFYGITLNNSADNAKIHNNSFYKNGKAGVIVNSSNSVNISDNFFNNTYYTSADPFVNYGFCNYSSSAYSALEASILICSANATIVYNNTIQGNGTGGGSNHNGQEAGIALSNSNYSIIAWNILNNAGDNFGIYALNDVYYNTFTFNVVNGTNDTGINFNTNDGIILGANSGSGMYADYNNVSYNNFSNNYEWNIFLVNDRYSNVFGNILNNSGASATNPYNIRLAVSSFDNVFNNTGTYSGRGISLETSSNNTVYNNTFSVIRSPNGYGIYFSPSSNNNIIFNNNFTTIGSDSYSCYSEFNSNNTVYDNNFITTGPNSFGIYLSSCSNHRIYRNNIFTNNSGGHGIYLYGSDSNNYSRNIVMTNGSGAYGIYFYFSTGNLVNDSIINASYNSTTSDVFVDGAGINNLTNCSFNKSKTAFLSGVTGSINVFWYADVYVNDSLGTAIESANVSVKDVNSMLQNWSLTNSSGYIPSRLTLREYRQNATSQYFDTNYTFNASKAGFFNNWSLINLTTNYINENKVWMTLYSSADTTPPNIEFVSPTPPNNNITTNNYVYVNVSATDTNNISTFIDWNNSLAIWYRMDDVNQTGKGATVIDYVGKNNGTAYGNAVQNDSGKLGKAYSFYGNGDYIQTKNNVGISGNSSITVSFWMKPGTKQNTQALFQYGTPVLGERNWTGIIYDEGPADEGIKIAHYEGDGPSEFGCGENTITRGQWNFVTYTYNGTHQFCYINGTYAASSGEAVLGIVDTVGVVGAYLGDYVFEGSTDDVMIFNRSLSAEEVQALYANTSSKYVGNNFTNLAVGTYNYTAYAQDLAGNVNSTEQRTISIISADTTPPSIQFVSPTPPNNNVTSNTNIPINVSINDSGSPNNLAAFIDWNRSLVAWFRLNNETGENSTLFRDWSSYENNGTCSGLSCPNYNSSGRFGGAMEFDGADYINISNSPSLNISGNQITLEAWVKPAAVKQNDWARILVKPNSNAPPFIAYDLIVDGNNPSRPIFEVTLDGVEYGAWTTSEMSQNTWMHIVGVYNGTNLMIYINGTRVNMTSQTGTILTNSFPVYIGYNPITPAESFNGTIDEVKIYNRALSPEEINASYNAGLYRLYNNFTNLADGTYNYTAYAQDLAGNVNSTETRNVTISALAAPTIDDISNLPLQNVSEGGLQNITFYVNVSDAQGYSTINNVNATFTKGATTRYNSSCKFIANYNDTQANYSCTVGIWYFDSPGTWTVNATTNDSTGLVSSAYSETFELSQTTSFVISPSTIIFATSIPGQENITSNNDPMLINNTGNANIPINYTSIKALDLYGNDNKNYFINSTNFSVGIITGSDAECSATSLANNTDVNITGAILPPGNNSLNLFNETSGQEQIYYCIKRLDVTLIAQTYSTDHLGSWIIKILASMVLAIPARRKRKTKAKKELDEDQVFNTLKSSLSEIKEKYALSPEDLIDVIKIIQERLEEKSVPLALFKEDMGALESLAKYLKENLNMPYHEIAKLLNRNDRTIWVTYRNALKKKKERLEIKPSKISIPLSIFTNRKLSILESLVLYLREKNLSFKEISELINRDQRNIWTINSRAKKKLKVLQDRNI